MKALITGVTGFAGGYLAEHLLRRGDSVLGVARNPQWPADTSSQLRDETELLSWDVTAAASQSTFETIARFRPDVVFHLAGMSVPADCGETSPTPEALAANVDGVRNVIALIERLEQVPRLAFASSCQVYAATTDSDPYVDESSPLGPDRAYGMTKLEAEQLILDAADKQGFPYLILRAFNHAGPRQAPRMMLSEWAYRLAGKTDGVLEVISLDSHLDLTDVRDTVRAYCDLAAAEETGIFNVGSGEMVRSGDVLEQLLRSYDAEVAVEELRPGRRQLPIANNERLRRAVDWRPEISLKQTIADTMKYWLEHTK